MSKSIFLLLIGLMPLIATAQQFTGKVVNIETQRPIVNAEVYFTELHTGTVTDTSGLFTLNDLIKSQIHIQISFIGFKTLLQEVNMAKIHEMVFYLEPSHIDLEEVVVSVPGGKLQSENIVNIERKKLSEITHASTSLAEAITSIPGVDQLATGPGIGKPIIRGLSGNRIVTYSQGIRVENQQWGDEHGLGIAEPGVESVEVIKGPASLLYGADAMGGVLYFVDERYARHNEIEGAFNTRFLSNTLGTYSDLGLKIHKEAFKMNVFGGYTSNADYMVPKNNRVLNSRFDEKSIKTSLGYNTKKWISNIRYSYLQNAFGITEDANYTTSTDRTPELPFQKIDHQMISLENTWFIHESEANLVLGYSQNDRQEFEDTQNVSALDMRLRSFTYNAKWHTAPLGDHFSLIVGSQGMHQTNANFGEEQLIPDATTNDVGLFTIANYDLDKLQLQMGLRGDYRGIETKETTDGEVGFQALKKSYQSLNYAIGGVYTQSNAVFRLNLASGFRAPNTSELLSNGVHEGTQRYEIGSANLQSEEAVQLDFTFDYHTEHISFSLSPFINFINHFIYLSPTDSIIDEVPVYSYQQNKAKLYGGEAGVHFHPHGLHWLHVESAVSTVLAEDSHGDPLPLIPATNVKSKVKAVLSQKGNIQIKELFLQYNYTFDQHRVGEFEFASSGYGLINIGCDMAIATKGKPIEISTGINNLANVRYISHLSRLKSIDVPNQGINFYLGIKLGFAKKLQKDSPMH